MRTEVFLKQIDRSLLYMNLIIFNTECITNRLNGVIWFVDEGENGYSSPWAEVLLRNVVQLRRHSKH